MPRIVEPPAPTGSLCTARGERDPWYCVYVYPVSPFWSEVYVAVGRTRLGYSAGVSPSPLPLWRRQRGRVGRSCYPRRLECFSLRALVNEMPGVSPPRPLKWSRALARDLGLGGGGGTSLLLVRHERVSIVPDGSIAGEMQGLDVRGGVLGPLGEPAVIPHRLRPSPGHTVTRHSSERAGVYGEMYRIMYIWSWAYCRVKAR